MLLPASFTIEYAIIKQAVNLNSFDLNYSISAHKRLLLTANISAARVRLRKYAGTACRVFLQ